MQSSLYLERWLLQVKRSANEARLEAHVRALDRKGGNLLLLEVALGQEMAAICHRKRPVGPRLAVATMSIERITRLRGVYRSQVSQHAGLFENGLRRYLKQTLALLESVESRRLSDADSMRTAKFVVSRFPKLKGTRPAIAARRERMAPHRTTVYHAAWVRRSPRGRFVVVVEERLLELPHIVARRSQQRKALHTLSEAEASEAESAAGIGIELVAAALAGSEDRKHRCRQSSEID